MKSIISVLVFLVGNFGFSQQKITAHIVTKKETIAKIANKYHVKQSDIKQLNPLVQNVLELNSVLFIPVAPSSKSTSSNTAILHTVQAQQTLYSLAKEYQVNVTDINAINPNTTAGLQIGQKIVIYKAQTSTKSPLTQIEYQVLPQETKYSIAKANNITIDELIALNPQLANQDLQIGQKILLPSIGVTKVESKILVSKIEVSKQNTNPGLLYEVLPKDSKFGIARKFKTTVEELDKLNPQLANNLAVGQKIYIPNAVSISEPKQAVVSSTPVEKTASDDRASDLVERLVLTAFQNIGTRYRPGGTTREDGFDCSGLIVNAFSANDIDLPRSSYEQSQRGEVVSVEEAKKGDLIFFRTRGSGHINHVGMVVEVKDGNVKFIHAASNGVIVSSIKESYYSRSLAQLNRVL